MTPIIASSSRERASGTRPAYRVAAPGRTAHGDQVGIAEIPAVLSDPGGDLQGSREVTSADVLVHLMDEQVAAFDDVPRLVLEQPVGAGNPAPANCEVSTGEQDQPEPEGDAHRAERLAGTQGRPIRLLQGLTLDSSSPER